MGFKKKTEVHVNLYALEIVMTCLHSKISSVINLCTYMNTVLEVTRTNNFLCFVDIGKTQVLKIFRFENKVL